MVGGAKSPHLTSGASLEVFDTLDSTSLEAKRRAAEGESGPLWIIARRQTSGYGRRGAAWLQTEGDVAASFLFPAENEANAAQLSFVAALALTETLRRFAPQALLQVKWPNDILAGGAKISGLLLEFLTSNKGGRPALCLGVGVNIISKPDIVAYATSRLADYLDGVPPSPTEFISVFDGRFSDWRARWRMEGFEPVRRAWLAIAARRGETIRVRLPTGTVEGKFVDLDQSGALVLDDDGEERRITAGEVFLSEAPRRE